MNTRIIKVLLVDDSPLALGIIKKILSSSPDIKVVGTAGNGKEALDLVPALHPDVICTDLHMPVMNGLEFTKEVMAKFPRPILVVSVSVSEGSDNVFNLLDAGAVDVFTKPREGLDSEAQIEASDLIQKVKIISGVKVFRRHPKLPPQVFPPTRGAKIEQGVFPKLQASDIRIVVIGASTGGPQAFHAILNELPPDFPLPLVCVQHISAGFLNGLVEWLASQCRIRVEIARTGDSLRPGVAYFPPEDTHLQFDRNGRFVTSRGAVFDGHRPSVTVTMESAAQCYGSAAIGILLTGMGRDGADGMKAITDAGGLTIAQDEGSSIVFGMPKQAIELGAAKYVMSLNEIGDSLLRMINSQRNSVAKVLSYETEGMPDDRRKN